MILPILVVAPSENRGRGIFTTDNIPANTIVEISPVLVLSAKERKLAEKTMLYDYIFEWGERQKKGCVALGYLSLYNHSYEANCRYDMDFEEERMTITTVRKIKKGEELFLNYNAEVGDKTLVWFDAR